MNCLQIRLDSEQLKLLPGEDGKLLSDHTALLIGSVGENIALRRAYCFQASGEILVAGYTHPSPQNTNRTLFGKYGALVAFKQTLPGSTEQETVVKLPLEHLGRLLCQHIIGKQSTPI
jgi:translation elongation factor EF-Ts